MPSWPTVFSPQHATPPLARRAQLCRRPVVRFTTALSGEKNVAGLPISRPTVTAVREGEEGMVELPSWPEALSPQQRAVPSATAAQVCPNPPAMATTLNRVVDVG